MRRRIQVELNPSHGIAIDGETIARAIGLEVAAFRQLMEDRRITLLCERGTGDDAGLYRATFYLDGKRVRVVVDGEGRIVAPIET